MTSSPLADFLIVGGALGVTLLIWVAVWLKANRAAGVRPGDAKKGDGSDG